jgi:hypothetical protein
VPRKRYPDGGRRAADADERARNDPGHRERTAVHAQRAAHESVIGRQRRAPQILADRDNRRRIRPLVGRFEQAARNGDGAHLVEVVAGDEGR